MDKQEEKDFATFAREWHDMMVRIWTDRIVTMNIHRTGTLQRSVHQQAFSVAPDGFAMQAAYRFVEYGIYVDAGTGKGYKRILRPRGKSQTGARSHEKAQTVVLCVVGYIEEGAEQTLVKRHW